MKADKIKAGDSVKWESSQGEVKGKVVKKITKSSVEKVGDNKKRPVKSTPQDPKVLVKSDKTNKQAVHKPSALKKITK